MNNEIAKTETTKLNADGNQIVSEMITGGGTEQIVKYGLIKLMNEKQERRVSLKTIVDIEKAQKANFTGKITIPELSMSVYISQIVMMRSETERVSITENFTKLPTTSLVLDLDLKPLNKIRPQLMRDGQPYYEACVHYVEQNGERQYYLDFNKIKRALKVEVDEDGYDFISAVYEYGVQK